jgi:hypothetical protein
MQTGFHIASSRQAFQIRKSIHTDSMLGKSSASVPQVPHMTKWGWWQYSLLTVTMKMSCHTRRAQNSVRHWSLSNVNDYKSPRAWRTNTSFDKMVSITHYSLTAPLTNWILNIYYIPVHLALGIKTGRVTRAWLRLLTGLGESGHVQLYCGMECLQAETCPRWRKMGRWLGLEEGQGQHVFMLRSTPAICRW